MSNQEIEARVRGFMSPVAINNLLDRLAYDDHATHRAAPTVSRTLDVHSNPPGLSVEDLAWCRGFGRPVFDECAAGLGEHQITVAMVGTPPGVKFTRPTKVR
jgi:hypothetical protein